MTIRIRTTQRAIATMLCLTLTAGCAAVSKKTHETTLADLTTVAGAMSCDEAVELISGL